MSEPKIVTAKVNIDYDFTDNIDDLNKQSLVDKGVPLSDEEIRNYVLDCVLDDPVQTGQITVVINGRNM